MITETVKNYETMSSVGASIIYDAVMRKLAKGERFNLGLAAREGRALQPRPRHRQHDDHALRRAGGQVQPRARRPLAPLHLEPGRVRVGRAHGRAARPSALVLEVHARDAVREVRPRARLPRGERALPGTRLARDVRSRDRRRGRTRPPASRHRLQRTHRVQRADARGRNLRRGVRRAPHARAAALEGDDRAEHRGHGWRRFVARAALRRHDGHGAHPRREISL